MTEFKLYIVGKKKVLQKNDKNAGLSSYFQRKTSNECTSIIALIQLNNILNYLGCNLKFWGLNMQNDISEL